MLLLVGLGNPGPEYGRNRHNIGFMVVDAIAERYGFPAFKTRFQGETADGPIDGEKILLLKPMTYMNRSGQSVGEALRYYKLDPDRLLVVHDDMDLAFGKAKIKVGGGSAGHNGIRSIDAHLGTPDYRRLRLGIGHPGEKGRVTGHVLSDFTKADRQAAGDWIGALAAGAPTLVGGDDARFLNDLALALGESPANENSDAKAGTMPRKGGGEAPASDGKTGLAAALETAIARLRGRT